jgi:hypothetical protein
VKKFVLLYHGYMEPTPEVMGAWQSWFAKLGDRFVDSGNPLAGCLEVTKTGSREVSPDQGAATGYSIISAESMEEAVRLLEGCPFVTSVRVYEAMAM